MSFQTTESNSFPQWSSNSPVGILTVTVVWAKNLLNNHHLCKPNPYVKLNLTNSLLISKKTSVKKKNLNPEWNEVFKIAVTNLEAQALQIDVFDWEQVGRHHNLGSNSVPLKGLTPNEPEIFTLDLLNESQKDGGQIVVNLNYKPFKDSEGLPIAMAEEMSACQKDRGLPGGGGLLVVIIHEAHGLEGRHHTNPYVDIIFNGEERKTEVVKKTKDPKWDQEFEFLCEEPPINDTIHVEVFSKPRAKELIYCKELLGYVDISLGNVVKEKRIKEMHHLSDSKNGEILIEIQWRAH
ncbi:hypothetical protein LUZ60_011897 [Juncus effusus]|nr:hypothetical protein LUZ60_011897 [Juncus effusus]